jgi:hypothetical protein
VGHGLRLVILTNLEVGRYEAVDCSAISVQNSHWYNQECCFAPYRIGDMTGRMGPSGDLSIREDLGSGKFGWTSVRPGLEGEGGRSLDSFGVCGLEGTDQFGCCPGVNGARGLRGRTLMAEKVTVPGPAIELNPEACLRLHALAKGAKRQSTTSMWYQKRH